MNAVNVGSISKYILDEFEVNRPRAAPARVRKIKQILTSLHNDDVRVALVFDECRWLNDKVLRSLKNFWEMTNGQFSRLLGVTLFGQPRSIEATIRDFKFKESPSASKSSRCLTMPSIEKSARDFLAHKLAVSGGDI